jgi:tripeptidyl-peptidase-2
MCFSFAFCSIVVNPVNISSGLHYYEVYGIDCKAPWRGPIFRVPITVIKPIALSGEPPALTLSNLSFKSGTQCFSQLFTVIV